jgi:uncharacterized protein (DUF58 family)
VELRFMGPRRGRFATSRVRVSTRFPFGLAEKSRELEVRDVLTVYPRRIPTQNIASALTVRDGNASSALPGSGAEPLLLRSWAPGDPLNQMHWRRSAQGRGWVTSVREKDSAREVRLDIDLEASPDPEGIAAVERRIENGAALADAALRKGLLVSLQAGSVRIGAGSGAAHQARLLEALAGVEPVVRGAA